MNHEDVNTNIGEQTRKAMLKLSNGNKHRMLIAMRTFYSTAVVYLIKHLPISGSLLRYVSCLRPARRDRKEASSITKLAQKFPHIKDQEVDKIIDQWNLYQMESSK